MTRSPLWRELETGDNVFFWSVRAAVLVGGVLFLLFAGVLDLTWPQQAVLGLVTLLVAIWMDRASMSYLVTLTLVLLSCYSTFRYGWWRLSTVYKFFTDPGGKWTWLDAFFIGLLLAAEMYSFCILALGYVQTLWPLRRTPVPLPEDTAEWPEIDLLIPTYNEPLHVVRYTALAAMNIDWPADKLNVYILDDGKREEFRAFAEEAGIGYMARDGNEHAKAGNINSALQRLDAPFVAIFDSDHVPTRSFFQLTMGWFGRDPKLGLMQTPHHFYSPDPFERNLGQFRTIPNEGELFYGVVQDGNDFWNATFFCGSCAVIRRAALDQIGGMAVETVTEDAHTSLRMQMHGWNTAYINIPQAAGLATERLSGHVQQRIRWARGMIQILRIDNPLFAPGLNAAQRLCYFNAMTHFLYALPRLIFLTSPLIYLVFKHSNIPGYWAAIFAYALPHLVLSNLTNSRIQGQHRHSFWNEIYETVLAPYIFLPTMIALINPKAGSFHVTAKGGVVNRAFFDTRIAQPFLALLLLNFIGLLCAVPRALQFPLFARVHPASWVNFLAHMYDGGHAGTILMNVLWTLFNITILGVATAVAWESQQRRQTVRVTMAVPANVVMPDGAVAQGVTTDVSSGGVMLLTEKPVTLAIGEAIELMFPVLDGDATLPATVVGVDGRTLRAHFDPLTMQEEEALTMVLYSRADTWLGWGETREADRPLLSMWRILQLSFHGLTHTVRGLMGSQKPAKSKVATSVFQLMLAMMLLVGAATAQGPGTFDKVFTLNDVGTPDAIVMRGVDSTHSVYFSLPQTEVVKAATLKLRYHFSPGLLPAASHLNVSINGTLFATLPVVSSANNGLLEATLTAPAEMLVHDNQLTFEFVGHYTQECEDASNSALWARVDADSSVELVGSLLPLQNDLKLLPMPFYEAGVNLHPSVAVVFMSQPSAKALQAAGIAASWIGILNDDHGVRFPVTVGSIPVGNAIVISENATDLPAALGVTTSGQPTIAIRANPNDPYSKVLVLTGDSADDLLAAAKALPLSGGRLAGPTANVKLTQEARSRRPDDAPRWLSTEALTMIGELPGKGDLHGEAGSPIGVYFRLPPDLYLNDSNQRNLALQMNYRYNGVPLANESTLQVFMNDGYVSSTPMPHTDKASMDLQTVIPIPRDNLRPFSNSMKMQFAFDVAKKDKTDKTDKCGYSAPANLEGQILKSSNIDIRGIPHWAQMPNLEIFANAGYPFTRMADLQDTAVVLPDQPSPEEIEMFLTMMGHFGAQTGYPVLNVTVTNADGMKTDGAKDYLLMGTVDDMASAIAKVSDALPVKLNGNGLQIEDTNGVFSFLQNAWWRVRSSDQVMNGKLEIAGGLPDAMIEGIEWPRSSGKSVVLIALRSTAVAPNFLQTFLKVSQSSAVSQSVSVLKGTQFTSYRMGDAVYNVGSLPWWVHLRLWFEEFPWVTPLMAVVVCFLMAVLLRATLRRKARRRLLGED